MPRRPHARCDCDETCNGCYRCYRATGETVCDWNCPHTADEHADDIEELAHGPECDCEACRIERVRDTAEEPCRD